MATNDPKEKGRMPKRKQKGKSQRPAQSNQQEPKKRPINTPNQEKIKYIQTEKDAGANKDGPENAPTKST